MARGMKTTRTHTRALVLVHSHVKKEPFNGTIDLSMDVIQIDTSKSIKSVGAATLSLVPRRNYLNYIFPNDVINIYFDPGDGQRGLVRTFFGYVDRIERTENTAENGQVSTQYRLSCSDFMKAVDKTDIYFNPHLQNRTEFDDPDLGLSPLGGSGLRTKGVTAFGSPSDMVENILEILMGFGSQWVLPPPLVNNDLIINRRKIKQQKALEKIPDNVISTLGELGIVRYDDANNPVSSDIRQVADSDTVISNLLAQKTKESLSISSYTTDAEASLQSSFISRKVEYDNLFSRSTSLSAYRNLLRNERSGASLVDLIDTSFIEALSIDGFIQSAGIWQGQGSVLSLMRGYSNEIVNELIFDLRPVAVTDSGGDYVDSCFGETYSRSEDDVGNGVNIYGTVSVPGSVPAVKYVPAIVFREYPFSTVEGLDLQGIYSLEGEGELDYTPFGPIFAAGVKDGDPVPRRVLYDYSRIPQIAKRENKALGSSSCKFEEGAKPLKHLDVLPIYNTDVVSSSLGRSDTDVFNFFSLYANNSLINIYKFLLQGIMPVLTPVSIQRNGLRVVEFNTKFANFGKDFICEPGSSAVDSGQIRKNLVRWTLLIDHWNQHNAEYLSGTITLRSMPELRVGYRLDWVDRNESYYVESVSHSWSYPAGMTTSIQVSRGQRNDPLPAYVPPTVSRSFGSKSTNILGFGELTETSEFSLKGGGNRTDTGRLADYFELRDTKATLGSSERNVSAQNDENIADTQPNADKGRIAIYPDQGVLLYNGRGNSYLEVPDSDDSGDFEDIKSLTQNELDRILFNGNKRSE